MLKKINNKSKKFVYIFLISFFILLFLGLIAYTKDSKKIREIREFIKTDIKLLYVTDNKKLDYPIKILDKYSIEYLLVKSNELSIFEVNKLRNIINSNHLDNILVIYKDGKILDALIKYENEESVNKFLQKNNIIPEKIVDNVEEITNEAKKIFENEYSMIYIPYKNYKEIENQDEIFKSIAQKYSIDYNKIDAFLLSKSQQDKINNFIGLSDVEDQILILIKDGKMIANIRGIHSKNTYIETLYDTNFINELENRLKKIEYAEFELELKNNSKSIILMGLDNCKDCDQIYILLNKMIYNYDIEVDYINLKNLDSDIYKKVNDKLTDIGYKEGFSLPLVVIVESNNILDYIVGNSNEEYFLDVFIENGVIKGDVINE